MYQLTLNQMRKLKKANSKPQKKKKTVHEEKLERVDELVDELVDEHVELYI